MRTAEFERQLKEARLPEREISVVLTNLEILNKRGISDSDLKLVVQNVIENSDFKTSFMRDPSSAERLGVINPDSM